MNYRLNDLDNDIQEHKKLFSDVFLRLDNITDKFGDTVKAESRRVKRSLDSELELFNLSIENRVTQLEDEIHENKKEEAETRNEFNTSLIDIYNR